jgi:integrase
MRQRYRLFRRSSGTFFIEDRATRRQESLRTKDKESAARLFHAKNEAYQQPALNLQIARAYLMASDPAIATRTWEQVMDEIVRMKHGETQVRWTMAIQDHAFDLIRNTPVIGTTAEQLLRVLEAGTISTNVYLRRIHNFALDMNWTPAPIIIKRQWPPVRHKEKGAITPEEHRQIIQREHNPEQRAFYELLWHLGGSQTDVATLHTQDVDLEQRTIAYSRRKTGVPALIHFGEAVAKILASRPKFGPLFPRLFIMHEKHRAKLFNRRCKLLNIQGVSLHSYRFMG